MKIAHLSDLHLCSKYKRENIYKSEQLIKNALNSGAEHIVISGDISDNANTNDYKILRKILKKYDLLRWDKTTVIAGNHDIFGGIQTAHDILKFPKKLANTNYNKKLRDFYESFEELFENVYRPDLSSPFPFVKEMNDTILLGINSTAKYSKIKNPFGSNGKVGKKQRELLEKIFDKIKYSEKRKIAVVHHHFYKIKGGFESHGNRLWSKIESFTMKLRGRKKLVKLFFENDVAMVLHGHNHEFKEYFVNGIKFLNAGASVDNIEQSGFYLINTEVEKTELISATKNLIFVKEPTHLPIIEIKPALAG